ncbi:ParB/RepB/Spo0J family partition protein [Natronocella acetinitrilica]|uniref:ParB/RepB/Spo0J family partition protein n=1 Tax=Natronocella acetinitrilica TaxID=414046 RepID=A0AAE3KFK7_9GAMM|nr:ParB/RepB/Spo0J family partition protein [Natronocella acetinitrilica]MCP1674167.1 ParB/RepB/Spo0J family partition protein [Natronocella acetinitrilica]
MSRKKGVPLQQRAIDELKRAEKAGEKLPESRVAELAFRGQGRAPAPPGMRRAYQRRAIDPNKIRPWAYADRHDNEMTHLDRLATSMKEHGQLANIIVRPLPPNDTSEHDYELLVGKVRWASAKKAGLEAVDCVIRDVDDREAYILMREENTQRQNPSPLSNARSLSKAIGPDGIFKTQDEACKALGSSPAAISRYLKFATIPDDVLDVISNPFEIATKMGLEIVDLIAENCRAEIVALAPEINKTIHTPEQLRESVFALRGGRPWPAAGTTPPASNDTPPAAASKPVSAPQKQVFHLADGQRSMECARTTRGVTVRIPVKTVERIPADRLDELAEKMAELVSAYADQSSSEGR